MKNIYPIYLPDRTARDLVQRFAHAEYEENTRYHSHSYRYEFSANVLESGDVELRVWYSFDEGYVMGSGNAFTKTVRPYNDADLLAIKRNKMMHLAAAAYEESEEQKRMKAILATAKQMFPNEEFQ